MNVTTRLVWITLSLASCLSLVPYSVHADANTPPNRDILAKEALQALDHGDYDTATQSYEQLIADGLRNGHVFYNLGIAYFRQDQLGEAMASFLAARRYLPRDPDVTANLAFTASLLKDRVAYQRELSPLGGFGRLAASFTAREYSYAAALSLFACGIWLLALEWRRRGAPSTSSKLRRLYASLLLVFPLVLGTLGAWRMTSQDIWGAITSERASVRSGPGSHHTVLFDLHTGAPFISRGKIVQSYLPIALADGKTGWIAQKEARIFY